MEKTQPIRLFPENYSIDPNLLVAKRYGTKEMCDIWGAENTFEHSLEVQGQAAQTLHRLHPDIISKEHADEIKNKATLKHIDPNRIRELEEKTNHDVISINKSLEEVISKEAATHVHKAKTSADTTQPAKALQLKKSVEVIANTTETLRDIVLERSLAWKDVPHMVQTHLYDALPSTLGRAFAHYAESLQKGLEFLRYVYNKSIIGKWGDATGDHHSATALGINGMKLQEEYCRDLGIGWSIAPAQVPALEFEADIIYALARITETANNLADYIRVGRGDDRSIFIYNNPKKAKGSSAMPHKDSHNGNPTAEEQMGSICNLMRGFMTTALCNCKMDYGRDLTASADMRIVLEDAFKCLDHGLRRMTNVAHYIEPKIDNCIERVKRTNGVVTSQQVMTYLTDHRRTERPMTRSEAHDLTAKLAHYAWDNKIPFIDVVLLNQAITSRLDESTLREITDPLKYIGQSKEIIQTVFDKYHKERII